MDSTTPTESDPVVIKVATSSSPASNASFMQASFKIGLSLTATVMSTSYSFIFSRRNLSKTISPVLSTK